MKNYLNHIQLWSGIAGLISGLFLLITQILESKFALAIFIIGVFLIAQMASRFFINAKRESFGIVVDAYPSNKVKIAKISKYVSFLLLLYPLYTGATSLMTAKKNCDKFKNKIGVLVTNFSNSSDDDFSYKLFNLLESKLINTDSLIAVRSNKFINSGSIDYLDSLHVELEDNCIKRGLLVFGKRSNESKMFDCNVFVKELPDLNYDSVKKRRGDIIFLQNPDVLNFSIDGQTEKVSDFVYGLLCYNSGSFEKAISYFQKASIAGAVSGNNVFVSHCYLYIGNSLLKKENVEEAISHYKKGIGYDSSNAFIHYNIGVALLQKKDSILAYKELELAGNLDNLLKSQYKEIEKLLVAPKPEIHQLPLMTKPKENISNNYESIEKTSKRDPQFYLVRNNGKFGVEDESHKLIVDYKFDKIDSSTIIFQGHPYFIVGNSNLYGAINIKADVVVPIRYSTSNFARAALVKAVDTTQSKLSQ